MEPLEDRVHKKHIERDHVPPDATPELLSEASLGAIQDCVRHIRAARERNRSVMVAFGAHAIKNGLAPVLTKLIEDGSITHLATNGAGIIHDWEFAYQGAAANTCNRW